MTYKPQKELAQSTQDLGPVIPIFKLWFGESKMVLNRLHPNGRWNVFFEGWPPKISGRWNLWLLTMYVKFWVFCFKTQFWLLVGFFGFWNHDFGSSFQAREVLEGGQVVLRWSSRVARAWLMTVVMVTLIYTRGIAGLLSIKARKKPREWSCNKGWDNDDGLLQPFFGIFMGGGNSNIF